MRVLVVEDQVRMAGLELAARLRALARRDGRGRPPVLAEGDLRLDPASMAAARSPDYAVNTGGRRR